MIVKPYELDKIKNDFKIFLFYGKNEGLKKLYVSQLLKKNKNDNVIKYEEKSYEQTIKRNLASSIAQKLIMRLSIVK